MEYQDYYIKGKGGKGTEITYAVIKPRKTSINEILIVQNG
jgi:hypothetical protein